MMARKRSGTSGPRRRTRPVVPRLVRDIVPQPAEQLPKGYPAFLADLKTRIRAAQVKAALSVNRELIELYWSIGRDIVQRQETERWGARVIDHLAKDLQRSFPALSGFSRTNVYRMRALFLAYQTPALIVPQPAGQLPAQSVSQVVGQSPPQSVTAIPWGHNVVLIERIEDPVQRLWYAQQTIQHGWSRAVLVHWIESGLYQRQGRAITNFKATLPAPQSDLATEIVRDPYNFDFLTLHTDAAERDLERGLLDHIRRFLLELGAGFAFVGQQVHLEVENEDFYLDLLFYHLRLRCYIVVELKVGPFKPEYAGKMNFYLSAVDDLLRHPDDKPSIGLILCKDRKRTIAEYALRDLAKPVGVARYLTRLVESLPPDLQTALPSIEQIETEMKKTSEKGISKG